MNWSELQITWSFFKQLYFTSDSKVLRWTQFCLLFFLITLSITSHSVQSYLQQNLQQLLGADLVISQYQPLPQQRLAEINQYADSVSSNRIISLTLTHGQHWQRAQLKAVDSNYPLQGLIKVATKIGEESLVQSGPKLGEIWLDSRLFAGLQLQLNQSINIAGHTLTVTKLLMHEPDRLLEGHSVAMRAMVSLEDFERLNLSNEKIKYRYLIEADTDNKNKLIRLAKQNLPGAQILHKESGHPLALFWQRTENFLGLTSVLLFLMAAIAINLAGRRQLVRQKRFIALCLSMGVARSRGVAICVGQWLMSFATLLGPAILAAYAAQFFAIAELRQQFAEIEASYNIVVLLKSILVLLCLLAAFQIPSWINISKVSIAALIRDQEKRQINWLQMIWSLLSISLLAAIYSDNPLLTGLTLFSMASTLLLLMSLTWLLLTLGERVSRKFAGLIGFSFYIMKKRLLSKATQILGVGLCATLLLFTLMLLKDIGGSMQKYTRVHDGNLMIGQATQSHQKVITSWADANQAEIRQLKPFVFAQLIDVNGVELATHAGKPSDSLAVLAEPVRVHYTDAIPANNRVVSGQWWTEQNLRWNQISVESEVMTDIGLHIGDKLNFLINDQIHAFEIVSSHVFRSGYGSITFWFQIPSNAQQSIQANSYLMGSLEIPDGAWSQLSELWQNYPTIRLVSLQEMTQRFDDTLALLTKLVLAFSIIICVLAALVIIASVKGFEVEDKHKTGLLLSFGLSVKDCYRLYWYEWSITSLIAASGAIFGTYLAGQLIYQSQFSMAYRADYLWLFTTLILTLIFVCSVGLLSCRETVNTDVRELIS